MFRTYTSYECLELQLTVVVLLFTINNINNITPHVGRDSAGISVQIQCTPAVVGHVRTSVTSTARRFVKMA